MSDDAHDALIAALDRGEVAGIGTAERIDTHAAHVFLAGDRAYKLKRPVAFSFLDFTTVAARRAALDAELRLNRRTAPDLYLAVLPITRETTGYALDGPGAPVEWVLVMRRFPEAAKLDRIADRGPLPSSLATRLGEAVACFHDAAEVRTDRGGVAAMDEVVTGNRADLAAVPAGRLDATVVATVDNAARAALRAHAELLEARRRDGFVRHCHGDLHLANIVTLDERMVPFDCIEFNDDFACIDTLYDLAFLLMDLIERDQRVAAWWVLDAYLDARRDVAGLALLPFFLAVRATIRAKVLAVLAGPKAPAAVSGARRYLDFACAFLPAPSPRLVAIGGFSGTGKTTLARALAPLVDPAPGALLLRSDVERKRLAGVAPAVRLDAAAYTAERTATCFAELRRCAAAGLAAGWSVIVDAVHGTLEERSAIEAVARRADLPFHGLWLDAPSEVLIDRVTARCDDASDADAMVVRRQLAGDAGPIAWQRLQAGGDLAATVKQAACVMNLNAGQPCAGFAEHSCH